MSHAFNLGSVVVCSAFLLSIPTTAQVIGLDARNGFDSAYNLALGSDFSGFRLQIDSRGYARSALTSFDSDVLAGIDALILLQPFNHTQHFSASELDAIEDFVARGKGLLVLGDAGGGSSASLINPLANRFGVTYADTGTDQAGHVVTLLSSHALTFSVTSVGVDYQRILSVSGSATDLTTGGGADNIVAVSGKAVFLSDSSLFADPAAGGDYPLSFGSNGVLLDNSLNYLAHVPEPQQIAAVTGVCLLVGSVVRRFIRCQIQ